MKLRRGTFKSSPQILNYPVADGKANTQAKIKTSEGIGSGMRAQGKEALAYGSTYRAVLVG